MKYTLLVTQQCNLACSYCYIGKRRSTMTPETARRIVDFAYRTTPPDERLEVGFFGGEPLMAFDVVEDTTGLFEAHADFDPERVLLTIVTNGTLLTPRIADFVCSHGLGFGISCDGPPAVHDRFRRFCNGRGSSARVARTIRAALEAFPVVMVNAVYTPETLGELPRTVDYFSQLGVRQIYLNPDFSAAWQEADLGRLAEVYAALGELYVRYYRDGDPHFISPIDSKISVILRGGYQPQERCRMGRGEFAFTPDGRIYPCERLVGDGTNGHCIGDLEHGLRLEQLLCRRAPGEPVNTECLSCGLRDYCMNWCGCSNFMGSGYYNRVSPFLCASEKASLNAAFAAFETLEQEHGGLFSEHLSGMPQVNGLICQGGHAP